MPGRVCPARYGPRMMATGRMGAIVLSREWEIVSEKFICPHCGNIVDAPGPADDAIQAVVDSMTREIRLLRETVAQLRGVRAG